jgi:F-type H+-transporting ATPase subunit alpha
VRPAINVGVSVSRVGGSAQIRALRTVSGRLRLDLAQYRELEAFAAFGSDLDRASKRALERGARLVELLKQPQYSPYPVERQVVSIWAGTTGALDDVPVADIRRFETDFLDHLAHEHNGIYESILESGKLEDDTVDAMKKAIEAFKKQFDSSEPLGDVNEAKAKAMAEGEEGAESVKVRKRAEKDDDGDSGNPKDKDDSGKAKDTGDAGKPKKESDSGGQKDSGDSGKPKKGSDSGKPKTESDSDKQKDS